MMEDTYKSIWTGYEIDSAIEYVRQFKKLNIEQALESKADDSDIQTLKAQLTVLEDSIQKLESKANGNIPVYTNTPSTTPDTGVASLYVVDKEGISVLCCKLANGTVLTLAPVSVTADGLHLTLNSPIFSIN